MEPTGDSQRAPIRQGSSAGRKTMWLAVGAVVTLGVVTAPAIWRADADRTAGNVPPGVSIVDAGRAYGTKPGHPDADREDAGPSHAAARGVPAKFGWRWSHVWWRSQASGWPHDWSHGWPPETVPGGPAPGDIPGVPGDDDPPPTDTNPDGDDPPPTGTDPGDDVPSPQPGTEVPVQAITNWPAQAASVMYGDGGLTSRAITYAQPGGLVAAGRTNYQDHIFKDISAAGGTVLIYLDAVIDNNWGRYHAMLLDSSECGPAATRWPGSPKANRWGYLNDFRVGSVVQQKLECVLEKMVAENPHMGGFFADDLGSRSWFPDINWNSWSAADKQAYRDGAVAMSQTFRKVADRHGLIVLVNGTWSANDGGGYPDVSRHGNALADGGVIEHYGANELPFWRSYACSSQWASQSPITRGKAFMWAITESEADREAYATSGCFAFVSHQPESRYDYVAPWGETHPTGLPSKVGAPATF